MRAALKSPARDRLEVAARGDPRLPALRQASALGPAPGGADIGFGADSHPEPGARHPRPRNRIELQRPQRRPLARMARHGSRHFLRRSPRRGARHGLLLSGAGRERAAICRRGPNARRYGIPACWPNCRKPSSRCWSAPTPSTITCRKPRYPSMTETVRNWRDYLPPHTGRCRILPGAPRRGSRRTPGSSAGSCPNCAGASPPCFRDFSRSRSRSPRRAATVLPLA